MAKPESESERMEGRAIIRFLQNKVFISFQLNHRNVLCLHYLLQSLTSFSLITYMRQELQITKLRCINEMENDLLFVIYSMYGRESCMCQRNLGECQHSLYLFRSKINYSNTDYHMYHAVLYTKVKK